MTSEGLILFFSWVRDWIICKVRLYPQHSAVTNLLVTENKKSTNYGRGKATIYISYLWKYDLQIYNFNRSLVYNLHRFGSKKVVYNLQYFGPNCLQSTSKFRAKSTIYIIASPPPFSLVVFRGAIRKWKFSQLPLNPDPTAYKTPETLFVQLTQCAGWNTLYPIPNRLVVTSQPCGQTPRPPVGTMSQLPTFVFDGFPF